MAAEYRSLIDLGRLRHVRSAEPGAVAGAFASRRRRPVLGDDGRLLIVAADHTARGVLTAGSRASLMADRADLLGRLLVALSHPGVDGVLATADILDDLALLGALDGRLAIGAVNRGGLDGAEFAIDDRITAFSPVEAAARGLDATKLLLRVRLDDDRSAAALERAQGVVAQAAGVRQPVLIEPFLTAPGPGAPVNDMSAEAMMRAISIASGIGPASEYSWLKIPVTEQFERVMASTTLPALLLGGDPLDDPDAIYARWRSALDVPGVFGLAAGRSLLYPADGDVERHVAIAAALVHG